MCLGSLVCSARLLDGFSALQKNADLALARRRKAETEAKSYDSIHAERKLTYEEEEAEWEESQKHGQFSRPIVLGRLGRRPSVRG